jgi:chaperone required for assembly of F1-ATPase
VLGLAVATNYLSAENAWPISRIDETWQEEQWGVDDAANAAAEIKRLDFLRAANLMSLLDQD